MTLVRQPTVLAAGEVRASRERPGHASKKPAVPCSPAAGPLDAVQVPLADALGLVTARPIVSGEAVPPFANSSMDGYALRAGDVAAGPARLRVVGALMAGDDPGGVVVGEGEAVRIMTGAAVPEGADAVCMVEHTRAQDGWVLIEEAVGPGTNVRRPGEDIAAGEEVFAAGESLGPAHIGVLASLGVARVHVFPRPRVGVVSTGDELVAGAGRLAPGKIRDSNRPGLLARLRADGFEPVDLGWAGDEGEALADVLVDAARTCDAVITSGGVSVGDRDMVKSRAGRAGGPAGSLVAGGGEAGETVRLLHLASAFGSRLRVAGQPRLDPGLLRVVRPACPAPHGGPPQPGTATLAGRGRLRHAPAARRQVAPRPRDGESRAPGPRGLAVRGAGLAPATRPGGG